MTALVEHVADTAVPVGGASVRFVDPCEDPGWDARVAQFDGATSFHSAGWYRVLKNTYGFRPLYALAEYDGIACGLLPLMEVNNFPKGRRGISLPFTDECCALGNGLVENLTSAV